MRVSSKVLIEDASSSAVIQSAIRESLEATLGRIGREHLDLLILHSYIRPSGTPPLPETASADTVREVIRPEFEQLCREGLILGWV